jgi:hypothetical protein
MDLLNLLPSDSAVMRLKHPATGEEIDGIELDIFGSDSRKFRELQKDAAKEILSRKRGAEIDLDDNEAKAIKRLAELTGEIRGMEEGGKPVTDAVYLYSKYKWIREQVDTFITDRANFLPKAWKPAKFTHGS